MSALPIERRAINRPAINRPAPSTVTSVTLSRTETPAPPPAAARALSWDAYVSSDVPRFKIAPRPRAVANVDGEVSATATAQSHAAEAALVLAAQWKTSLLDRAAGRRSRDLSRTVEPVMEALLSFGPAAIDLRDLPADRVNGMHLAVVLRATFTRRAQTPGWNQALAVAQAALRRDNISVDSALSGLL